jgi:hypothetical protein
VNSSAVASAIEFLAECGLPAVRLHAARSLGSPRKFGPIARLREDAERDMFARDVRELFLVSYSEALRQNRLRGEAAAVLGRVLACNCEVVLDALIARGCLDPSDALNHVLDGILSRAHRNGFFLEPHQWEERHRLKEGKCESRFVEVTAAYLRYLLVFGRAKDPRVRAGFDWLVSQQDADGAFRPEAPCAGAEETGSYVLSRRVALAFAELPTTSLKRWGNARRRLADAWTNRVLPYCESPDAVLTEVVVAPDPLVVSEDDGPALRLPEALRNRILYFPLEDLWLALSIGASPEHPHLARWIGWLEESQLADGSWRLQDPSLRERLLLSDPNGRLRAEALHLTDEWITLRCAQILRLSARQSKVDKVAKVAHEHLAA